MTVPITICDDSSFARKQMARALPPEWDVEVHFATNGAEGIEAIKAGQAHILFLDLTMPVMDGYQVLEQVRAQDLPTLAIVVSGDIQPEARSRVKQLGALEFIKKPIDADSLSATLQAYGLLQELAGGSPQGTEVKTSSGDWYQELANVAMGRSADLVAQLLDRFVSLSVPRVTLCTRADLGAQLDRAFERPGNDYISQGFIGRGIGGEAIVGIAQADLPAFCELLLGPTATDEPQAQETTLMELSSLLLGAFLKGLAEQLEIDFSQNHPTLFAQLDHASQLLNRREEAGTVLLIEIGYHLDSARLQCHQVLLFTPASVQQLDAMAQYLVD